MSKQEKKPMTISEILPQLSSLKDNSKSFAAEPGADEIWSKDIKALDAAAEILSILEIDGITDVEILKEFIHNSNLVLETNKEYNRKYVMPERAYPKDSVWHCPECSHRVQVNHNFCHWCGKRLAWR